MEVFLSKDSLFQPCAGLTKLNQDNTEGFGETLKRWDLAEGNQVIKDLPRMKQWDPDIFLSSSFPSTSKLPVSHGGAR